MKAESGAHHGTSMNQSRPGGKLAFASVSAAIDGRWSNRPSRFDRKYAIAAEMMNPAPSAERQDPDGRQPLRDLGDGAAADEQQADAAEREHDAGLHRPQHAVEGRAERTRGRVERDGRRLEEAPARRRLHVGQQIVLAGEPIEQLRVRLGLHAREPDPPPVVDDGAHEPDEHAGDEQQDGEDHQALHHVFPHAENGVLRIPLPAVVRACRRSTRGCGRPPDAARERRPVRGTAPGSPRWSSASDRGAARHAAMADGDPGSLAAGRGSGRRCSGRSPVPRRPGRLREQRSPEHRAQPGPGAAPGTRAVGACARGNAEAIVTARAVVATCLKNPFIGMCSGGPRPRDRRGSRTAPSTR